MLIRDHISDDVLLDYADSRLNDTIAGRVRSHLDTGCDRCATELSFWMRMLPSLQADRAPGAPDAVLSRAYALFNGIERAPTTWQRFVATLVFDSRTQPILAGARDLDGGAFRLLYKSDGAHIDLRCERNLRDWTVIGQVLTVEKRELGWNVIARRDTTELRTDTDALGEFRMRNLEPGDYKLVLRDNVREIVLPPIHL
jgi:hypothetical protein